jgi:hypothetical protein
MSGRFARCFYRSFLFLHPEPFRMEFGAEMLEIFETSAADQGVIFVLLDALRSAARQQIRYHTVPAPTCFPLYSEIAASPELAGIFASSALVLTIALSAGLSETKPKAPEFQILNATPHISFLAPALYSRQPQ